MAMYVSVFDTDGANITAMTRVIDGFELRPGLWLISSQLPQSKLYHLIKRHLADDAGLLVCRAEQPPKFKGMAEGALNWTRDRADPAPSL